MGCMYEHEQEEIVNTHEELCETLHNNMDDIPKSVRTKIWDLVYKHYEP